MFFIFCQSPLLNFRYLNHLFTTFMLTNFQQINHYQRYRLKSTSISVFKISRTRTLYAPDFSLFYISRISWVFSSQIFIMASATYDLLFFQTLLHSNGSNRDSRQVFFKETISKGDSTRKFIFQECYSTSITASLDFFSKTFVPHQEHHHQICLSRLLFNQKMQQHNLQEFIQTQEHTYQIFLQDCSSIHNVPADFLSPLILSPLIYSIILHRKIWHRHTLFQELSLFLFSAAFSPLLIFFSAVSLSPFLGFNFSRNRKSAPQSFSLSFQKK